MHVLESVLGQLLFIVKDEAVPNEVSQLAFQLLYHITKVNAAFVIPKVHTRTQHYCSFIQYGLNHYQLYN